MIRGALVILATGLLLSGCSTHREDLEPQSAPKAIDPATEGSRAAAASIKLIERHEHDIAGLSAESLAPLGQASAISFKATGAPGLRKTTRTFADRLLEARVHTSAGTAFFGASAPGRPDRALTPVAAGALIDAFQATGDGRYRAAALDAVPAVTSSQLGWRKAGRLTGVAAPGSRRLDVALTSQAAFFLARTATELGAGSRAQSKLAYKTVLESQAALGNWYATVGTHEAQSLAEWAISLQALLGEGSKTSVGVAGGGVPKLHKAAFTPSGRPASNGLARASPIGVPEALKLFQASSTAEYANTAMSSALDDRRADGTVRGAEATAGEVQSQYALAFAIRAFTLLKASRRHDSR